MKDEALKSYEALITIDQFCKMLGLKTRFWYYKNADNPAVPQRVYVGNEPRLALSECVAYVQGLKDKRGPKAPPLRKGGRPRRVTPPAAASPSR